MISAQELEMCQIFLQMLINYVSQHVCQAGQSFMKRRIKNRDKLLDFSNVK